MTKRDLIAEIKERRTRYTAHIHAVGAGRIENLRSLLLRKPLDEDLLGYFPVAAFAALESSFRAVVKEAIDSSPDIVRRLDAAGGLKEARLDWDLLAAIVGRTISVGELVAHLLPFSHISHIEKVITALVGSPCRTQLANASRRSLETGRASIHDRIIQDVDQDLAHVVSGFAIRHQVAHEGTLPFGVSRTEIEKLLAALERVAEAILEIVDQHLFPEVPLTQSAMTQQTANQALDADATLEAAWLALGAALNPDELDTLQTLQEAFASYRAARTKLALSAHHGGTMAPMLANIEYEAATEECSKAVVGLARVRQPDWGTGPAEA